MCDLGRTRLEDTGSFPPPSGTRKKHLPAAPSNHRHNSYLPRTTPSVILNHCAELVQVIKPKLQYLLAADLKMSLAAPVLLALLALLACTSVNSQQQANDDCDTVRNYHRRLQEVDAARPTIRRKKISINLLEFFVRTLENMNLWWPDSMIRKSVRTWPRMRMRCKRMSARSGNTGNDTTRSAVSKCGRSI